MKRRLLAACAILLLLIACDARTGDAVVTGKEHIPAATAAATPQEHRLAEEQWIVNVEMVDDGRRVNLRVDKPVWERVTIGQRLRVTYREGKYTGTIWDSEIVE
jgi:uncharacterized OB-fold protein